MIICTAPTTESQRELINAINIFGSAGSLAFNESLLLCADGVLDFAVLQKAAARLSKRHDSLRMTFSPDGTALFVHDLLLPAVDYVDASTATDPGALLDTVRKQAVVKVFDITIGPLLRLILLRESATKSTVIIVVHHLVCDGWSYAVLLEDLALLYSQQLSATTVFLAQENHFIDYMKALGSDEYRAKEKSDLDFWTQTYQKLPDSLELPTDYPVSAERSLAAGYQEYVLDAEFVQKLRATARQHKCSLVVLLLTAFGGLMNRLTGNASVVVALPAAGQAMTALDRVIGHCVNTLPVLINIDDNQAMAQQLAQFRDNFFAQIEHQHITQGALLQRLPLQRDLSRAALASVMFNLDQDMHSFNFADITVKVAANPRLYEYFDLFLNVADNTRELTLQCQFNKSRFKDATIQSWLGIYRQLLEGIILNASRPLAAMPLVPANAEWLDRYRATARGVQQNIPPLMQHLNDVHVKSADKIAIACDESSLRYHELFEQSNQIARLLVANGVERGGLVGICLDRNINLLPCLLGIWKAGAGYVPLDPAFPPERLVYMVQSANPALILIQPAYQAIFSDCKTMLLDTLYKQIPQQPATDFTVEVDGNSRAYVIFTSGSTGKPKGVEIPRRAVANFLAAMSNEPGMSANDVLLAVTTLSFDISVLELILPLWVGATVVVAQKDDVVDGSRLLKLIEQHKINYMQATPSTWKLLLQAGWQANQQFKLLCGGEAFPADLAAQLVPICKEVWNMYGPTETTVWSTCHLIKTANSPVVIGKPIANTQCYVTDTLQQLLPVGIPGELLIGGDGLALGYIGQPELTRERFVDNPFGEGKVYRTGDKVRWTQEGVLEYTGRMDSQVKLRGYRIELGEIETVIRRYPAVMDCALAVKSHREGDSRLVAYIVNKPGQTTELIALNNYLREWLPDYMLPQHVVAVASMPRTPNGKLDRKNLPDLVLTQQSEPGVTAPSTNTEKWLAGLWSTILGVSNIGSSSKFFELGGHSLLIAQLIQKIANEKSIQLDYRDVFNNQSLASLAVRINEIEGAGKQAIHKIPRRDKQAKNILSLAQQRLWYLDKLDPGSTLYNLPAAFRFIGKFDKTAFINSFSDMINRHESLRTTFTEIDGEPLQKINDGKSFVLNEVDISDLNTRDREARLYELLDGFKSQVFNLEEFPLFKTMLIKLSADEHALLFMPHHAIFDGWSFDIFVHEITTGYCKHIGRPHEELAELPIQYADYAIWLRSYLTGEELNAQLQYWVNSLQGNLPLLEMPLDKVRPEAIQNKGEEIFFEIDESTVERITAVANQQGVSIFMLFFSIYALLLSRYTGQQDIVIGAPMADRTRAGTENLIGFFVNALVLRIRINPEQSFIELLQQVKEICLAGFANQDTPFEKLVEALNPARDLGRAPLFQTSLTYQDVSAREIRMGEIEIKQIEVSSDISPLDLNCWLKRRGERIAGAMVYSTSLFERQTIEQFTRHFLSLVSRVGEYQGLSVLQIPVLTDAERQVEIMRNVSAGSTVANSGKLVHEVIDTTASRCPESIAASCSGINISYADLYRQSNQFANYLVSQGVVKGVMVGVCVDRSLNMLIALLGIMKTGAAYVPLDPEFPRDRIRYMIQDAKLKYIVTETSHLDKLPTDAKPIVINQLASLLLEQPALVASTPEIKADDIVYMIYTSGSTGNPKGVMVQHGAVVNFLTSMAERPGLASNDKLLAVTTLSFDIAVLELYLPLVVGAQVVIATKQESSDSRLLLNILKANEISAMQATPATWRMLVAAGWQKAARFKALCGGEALTRDLAISIKERSDELWNMYGPTETTVWSTCGLIEDPEKTLSIGTAIANTQIYILDELNNPVPRGVAGELYIGGEGVTKGYLNNPGMTHDRFIENPITKIGKIYKTGDRARYRFDGALECLGRIDTQVKVRGYRIELGEIETAMRSHPNIEDCAVTVIGDRTGDARLVAFVVWKAGASLTVTEVRNYLRDILPMYMIPQHLVELDNLPKTPNMKLDRKALAPLFTGQNRKDTFIAPTTASESWLADLWKKIIGIDRVGAHDNFFDLGGHSLLSMQVINQISSNTGINIHPRDLLLENLSKIAAKIPQTVLPMATNQSNTRRNSGITGLIKNIFKR